MTTGVGGFHLTDNVDDLDAAVLNQLPPHGLLHQITGTDGLLEYSVRAINWFKRDGTFVEIAATSNNVIGTSITRFVIIDIDGTLTLTASITQLAKDSFVCGRIITNGSQITIFDHINVRRDAALTPVLTIGTVPTLDSIPRWFSITVPVSLLTAALLSQSLSIIDLPARGKIHNIEQKVITPFTGGGDQQQLIRKLASHRTQTNML